MLYELQFAAESEAGSSDRPGEQPESSVHVSAHELQASSPGRPTCSVQEPWVQALEFELGTVFDSRVPVHKVTESSRQGSTHAPVPTGSGSSQALSSLCATTPCRPGHSKRCTVCGTITGLSCAVCRWKLCSKSKLCYHERQQAGSGSLRRA